MWRYIICVYGTPRNVHFIGASITRAWGLRESRQPSSSSRLLNQPKHHWFLSIHSTPFFLHPQHPQSDAEESLSSLGHGGGFHFPHLSVLWPPPVLQARRRHQPVLPPARQLSAQVLPFPEALQRGRRHGRHWKGRSCHIHCCSFL